MTPGAERHAGPPPGGLSGASAAWLTLARVQSRFAAIWVAVALLLLASAALAPSSLQRTSLVAVLPFVAFLAIASMGQALVIMTGGIDLSIPSIITMVGVILLAVSRGSDANLALSLVAALLAALGVGLGNGVLVAVFRLNALVVTLAVGTLLTGMTLWYRDTIQRQESQVPPTLAAWGAARVLDIPYSLLVALVIMAALTVGLHSTTVGRRFTAVGANPTAARVAGLRVERYQIGAYALAALLYAVAGILLSGFIRNPTLELGSPYLLAPIAAVVLGGASLAGGVGSMVATVGGALFLTQLSQVLKVMGLSSAVQFIIQGVAIAAGMALARVRLGAWLQALLGRGREQRSGASADAPLPVAAGPPGRADKAAVERRLGAERQRGQPLE